MRFDWDDRKNASNHRKYGVDFVLAEQVFNDPLAFMAQDRFVDGEERWWTVGLVEGRILQVSYAVDESGDEESVKIISARKATPKERERRDYERGT